MLFLKNKWLNILIISFLLAVSVFISCLNLIASDSERIIATVAFLLFFGIVAWLSYKIKSRSVLLFILSFFALAFFVGILILFGNFVDATSLFRKIAMPMILFYSPFLGIYSVFGDGVWFEILMILFSFLFSAVSFLLYRSLKRKTKKGENGYEGEKRIYSHIFEKMK